MKARHPKQKCIRMNDFMRQLRILKSPNKILKLVADTGLELEDFKKIDKGLYQKVKSRVEYAREQNAIKTQKMIEKLRKK